jgi:multidrug efflux system membrane fusion protein
LVVTATATRRDVPFYAEGLGRVRALNTVLVRSQVDGQITEIAFKEGQEVRAGDLLVQIDPRPFEAALKQKASKCDQDQAQLDSARKILASDTTLQAKGMIDQQAFDVQQASVRALEALVAADEAAVGEAGLELEHTHITSPISGRAGLRMVDRGNLVHANDAAGLVVINEVQPITVTFTLPERQLQQIGGGRQPEGGAGSPLLATAFDQDYRGVLDAGQLAAVDNQIDEATGTIRCKALFPNEHLALWPGQFVNIRLLTETRKAVLTIPAAAIQQGTAGYFTYVVGRDLTVEPRPLKVAQIEGDVAVIDEGLAAGETVVIDGQYSLRPGATVRVADAKKPGP